MNLIKTPFLLILFNTISSAIRNIQPILQTTEPIQLHHGKTDYDYRHANTPNPENYLIENTAVRLMPELSTTQNSMILNVNQRNTKHPLPWSNYHSSAPKRWHTRSRTERYGMMSLGLTGGSVTARQAEKPTRYGFTKQFVPFVSKQPFENSSLQSITNLQDVTEAPISTERAVPKVITILSTKVMLALQPPGTEAKYVISEEGSRTEPPEVTTMEGSRDTRVTVLSTIRSTLAPIAQTTLVLDTEPTTAPPAQTTSAPPAQTLLPTKGPISDRPTDLSTLLALEQPEISTELPPVVTEDNSVLTKHPTEHKVLTEEATGHLKTVEPFKPGTTTAPRTQPPVILEQFSERLVHFGGSVTILCTGKGRSVRSVSIHRVGSTEMHTERGTAESVKEARLVINPVLLHHAGEYTCTVSDSIGSRTQPLTFIEVVDLCSDVVCKEGTVCAADPDRGSTKCERFCPECLAPMTQKGVCGDDCVNYDSLCQIERANCQFDSMVMPIGQGLCYDLQAKLIDHTYEEFILDLNAPFELYAEFLNVPQSKVIWYKLTAQEEGEVFYKGAVYSTEEPTSELAGRYVAEATSCNGDTLRTPIITVLKEEAKEPSNVCSVFGDPNIITFDGYTYTYKGTCHHVLAMDCEQAQWFVYGGFQKTGDHSSEVVSVTIYTRTTSVELQQGWVVNSMGRKQTLTEGIPMLTGDMELLYDGIYLQASLLSAPNTPTIYWDGISTVHISLPASLSTRTCGLCGNNDRDPSNDLAGSRHGPVSTPKEFAASWMLNTVGFDCPILTAARRGNVKKDLKSEECREVLDSLKIKGCALSRAEHQFILDSCIADTLQADTPLVSVKCAIGEMYTERCYIKTGVRSSSSWQRNNSCPDKCQYRQIAVDMGCPQTSLPYSDC